MTLGLDLFTVLAVSAGCLFFVAGTVGLLRFPDTLTRLHALTQADNLGLGLIVLGVLPQSAGMLGVLKLLCVWPIAQVSSAVVSPQITAASARRARCALACGCCRCRRAALGDHPAVANMPLQAALAPAALWEALWPMVVGALLAAVLQHWLPSVPRVPPGDVLTLAMRAAPAARHLAAVAVRIDARLLQWPVAGVLLVALTVLLAAALLSGA
jgi:multicomponent Na+:H+ antiporter subunit G